jgi:transcriptional regulator with XRE-family HTH domain
LTPRKDGWYYLTMPKARMRPHPLDDPDMSEGHRVMREICSRILRETRMQAGWTQRWLALQSGVSLSTVAKAEQGRQNLSMDTLVALMSTMGFGIGLIACPPGYGAGDIMIDIRPHDEDDHEEDNAPDPDKTEEELEQEIIREITRAR